jgi:hypothetical protein
MSLISNVAEPLFLSEEELRKIHQKYTVKHKVLSDSRVKELNKKRLKEAEDRLRKMHATRQAAQRREESKSALNSAPIAPDDIQRMLSALVPAKSQELLSFSSQFELKQVMCLISPVSERFQFLIIFFSGFSLKSI